ncbi:MAG: hypothetical protein QOE94_1506 [Mycobacterium sp.]|nr:hypothetical protein [Mycobacterium sp.]
MHRVSPRSRYGGVVALHRYQGPLPAPEVMAGKEPRDDGDSGNSDSGAPITPEGC